MAMDLPLINKRIVFMATLEYTTSGAKSTSQVLGPLHDSIQVIWPYIGEKLNGMNVSTLRFEFAAHLIKYDLKDVLVNNRVEKVKNNKISLILLVALASNQFLLVNKTSTSTQAWSALKSFYQKKKR